MDSCDLFDDDAPAPDDVVQLGWLDELAATPAATPRASSVAERLDAWLAERCLDPTHASGCSLCSRAPELGDDAAWTLSTPAGGEKALRKLLTATPEWGDESTRLTAVRSRVPLLWRGYFSL